jgi:hypothetical protein
MEKGKSQTSKRAPPKSALAGEVMTFKKESFLQLVVDQE